MDEFRTITQYHLEGLLERGVKALIFVGKTDLSCNWVANMRMVDLLEWHGAEGFVKEELSDWYLNGDTGENEPAGQFKGSYSEGLAFWTFEGAGHMVCMGNLSISHFKLIFSIGSIRQACRST